MGKIRKLMAVLLAAGTVCLMTGAAGAEVLEETAPELDGILLVSLPDEADGTLTYGGRALLTGESVPAEHLDQLAYEPGACAESTYSYIPVYTDGSIGEETVCTVSARSGLRPTAKNIQLRTYRNLTVSGIFPVTDDGADYTCQVLTQPTLGMVTAAGGTFVYTPYQNRTGTDTFTYIVRDAQGAWSEEATVSIDIEKQKSELVYSDLSGNAAQYAAVRLAEEAVYMGRSVGGVLYFEPDEPVTRGEFIAMTLAAAGYEPAAAASTFFSDDGSIPAWTRAYVATAVREGIVCGENSGENGAVLRAADSVTLAEAAVILDNAVSLEDGETAITAASVPVWAAEALSRLCANGILAADAGDPLRVLTRGEAAGLLLNLMNCREAAAVPTGFFSWTTM